MSRRDPGDLLRGPAPAWNESTRVSFMEAVRVCFRKYAVFSGRAGRSEYWWFVLFTLLVGFLSGFLSGYLLQIGVADADALVGLVLLALILPLLAVGVRRLHDTGRSGWWLLVYFIPLVGWMVLIVLLASRGDPGPNRYGAFPSAASSYETAVPVTQAAAPPSHQATVAVAPTLDPQPDRARLPPEGLSAFRLPDPDEEIVKRLEGGQEVEVIERLEGWALVRDTDGETWWIDGRRLL
jgi:uncharacterized membrane protein YhaH (DUF805 family)